MRTIAVIARKGGSGKTTLAVHLAIAAHLSGRNTVVADADPQRSAMEVLKPREAEGPPVIETTGRKLFALQVEVQRTGADLMIIDTAAGLEESLGHAIVLADLSLLVVRPTFLDIAAAVQSLQVIRRMRRAALVVLNQAPAPRDGVEPPAVKRTLEAFKLLRAPVVPPIIRARSIYQTALEAGRAAQELAPDTPAAREMGDLWDFVDNMVFGRHSAWSAG
jgi:chromosome partitioning protein